MKRPTEEQMNIAIHWLENNEGVGEEQDACVAVGRWLDKLLSDDVVRKHARDAGIPVATVRRRIRELSAS